MLSAHVMNESVALPLALDVQRYLPDDEASCSVLF